MKTRKIDENTTVDEIGNELIYTVNCVHFDYAIYSPAFQDTGENEEQKSKNPERYQERYQEYLAREQYFKELVTLAHNRTKQNAKELYAFYWLCRNFCQNRFAGGFYRIFLDQIDKTVYGNQAEIIKLQESYLIESAKQGYIPAIIDLNVVDLNSVDENKIIQALIKLYDFRENASRLSIKTNKLLTSTFVHFTLPEVKPQNLRSLADRIKKDRESAQYDKEYTDEIHEFLEALSKQLVQLKVFYTDDTITIKKVDAIIQLQNLILNTKNFDLKYVITIWKNQYHPAYGTVYNLIKEQRRVTGFFSLFNPVKTKTQRFIDQYCPIESEPQNQRINSL